MGEYNGKIKVLIADDETVARSGIRGMLAGAEDIEIIGEAQDGFEVQKLVDDLLPRVLLLDLKMPGPFVNPVDMQRWLMEHHPEIAVLPLTGHGRDALLAQLKETGAAGYLEKNITAEGLINSIRLAAAGVRHFAPEQEEAAARWHEDVGNKWKSLTQRENEIARWIVVSATNRGIAGMLGISEKTVESHVTKILSKLGMSSYKELIPWVFTHFPEEIGGNW